MTDFFFFFVYRHRFNLPHGPTRKTQLASVYIAQMLGLI